MLLTVDNDSFNGKPESTGFPDDTVASGLLLNDGM